MAGHRGRPRAHRGAGRRARPQITMVETDAVTGATGRPRALPVTQLKGHSTMAEYVLPDLDYDYGALEPHISGEIMELHHSKHHATYVKGANDALEQLAAAREDGSISGKAPLLSKNLAFHLGGHTNHSIFWKNLSPNGGGEPTSSRRTSTPSRPPCRAPAGPSSGGTTSVSAWSSSSSPTSRATSR